METVVRYTPLCGVGEDSPLCSLLEIDDYTILLDCGWDDSFDVALLDPVLKCVCVAQGNFRRAGELEGMGRGKGRGEGVERAKGRGVSLELCPKSPCVRRVPPPASLSASTATPSHPCPSPCSPALSRHLILSLTTTPPGCSRASTRCCCPTPRPRTWAHCPTWWAAAGWRRRCSPPSPLAAWARCSCSRRAWRTRWGGGGGGGGVAEGERGGRGEG